LYKSLHFLLLGHCLYGSEQVENAFESIYSQGVWDAEGFSLANSTIGANYSYVIFLQNFLKENAIRSVVDIGCGDWRLSAHIDWSGIDYQGFDVVKYVVDRNTNLYGTDNIHFTYADVLDIDLPDADLVICKDVFQHLPNSMVLQLLTKFSRYRHCLITDYVGPPAPFILNGDIPIGSFRPIDLMQPPFNVKGKVVLTFPSTNLNKQSVYLTH
jgi:SAM-dependent methyltransferase